MTAKFKPYFKYFFFATSIIVSRGLEYIVLFYAALYLTKDSYGELEFYKKIIELGAVGLAFGLPSLLLTYTKSHNSKVYLNLLGVLFVLTLSIIIAPVFWILDYQFLIIPILFHAIFFNNGIIPVFFITNFGSNKASLYKIITSVLFYVGVLMILILHSSPEHAFIFINYFLIGLGIVFIIILFDRYKINLAILKKYYSLFKKLLISSLTLVVSNFANVMFLYTDIMILKLISNTPNVDIANYSFVLNIANMLILLPFTLVQVDIEKIKALKNIRPKAVKIFKLVLLFAVIIIIFYLCLIKTYYKDYNSTLTLFLIIMIAKLSQTNSILHGAILLIKKKFRLNLIINITMLTLNIVLSYALYNIMMLNGIAIASVVTLTIRYFILQHFTKFGQT